MNINPIETFKNFKLKMTPRPTAVKALELFDGKTGVMIDLGAGAGADCAYFLAHGWEVIAVDINTAGVENMIKTIGDKYAGRISVIKKRFHNLTIPAADLVVANYSLPFCGMNHFPLVWENAKSAIKPGGRFAGTFFGPNDGFKEKAILLSPDQIEAMFEGFEYEYYSEDEQESEVMDQKGDMVFRHWHIYQIVAKKRNMEGVVCP
jgi:SAM-dependent methyltransferase